MGDRVRFSDLMSLIQFFHAWPKEPRLALIPVVARWSFKSLSYEGQCSLMCNYQWDLLSVGRDDCHLIYTADPWCLTGV
jgi:hypothetical protein